MRAFSLVDPSNPMRVVDLLLKPEVPFEELLVRSQEAFVGKTSVRVASLDDLITLKRHAGRPQDLADIKELEAIRKRKGDY
jgi:predicted nucleotidyltransferase